VASYKEKEKSQQKQIEELCEKLKKTEEQRKENYLADFDDYEY
jgi:hypothetical protein